MERPLQQSSQNHPGQPAQATGESESLKQKLFAALETRRNHFADVFAPQERGEEVSRDANNDTLSGTGKVPVNKLAGPDARKGSGPLTQIPGIFGKAQPGAVMLDNASSGGQMADLSAYKDLSKAPISFDDENGSPAPSSGSENYEPPVYAQGPSLTPTQHFVQEVSAQEVDTEFSGNVKTLIRLVNELPEGVTKQTGAQIIRLTMEAMGISMENVLSEAQSAQSEMLDAVRANIKKIEEYKTVIRKLETDIKYYQGKANELSEIIDLFILSNTSGQKNSFPDDFGR